MITVKTKSQVFFAVCVSLISGNLIAGVFDSVFGWILAFFLMLIFMLVCRISPLKIALFCLALLLTFLHFLAVKHNVENSVLREVLGGPVKLRGVVVDEPIQTDKNLQVVIQVNEVDGIVLVDSVRVLVFVEKIEQISYGDSISLDGEVEEAAVFEDFNYRDYLYGRKISAVLFNPLIKVDAQADISFRVGIFKLKKFLLSSIQKNVAEPESAFLAGLLIGDRTGFSDELTTDFNRTGLTHIVAISGYNIALIILILRAILLRFFTRKYSLILIVLGVFSFVVLTGASASVVRAGIMGVLIVVATTFGRVQNSKNVLVATAVLMMFFNPYVLTHDVGFQLSFVSTVAIIYFSSWVEKWISFVPSFFGIRESLALTAVSLFATFPISVLNFKTISIVSIVANVIVAPFLPLAMLCGALGLVFSWNSLLSSIFFGAGYVLLKVILQIATTFSQIAIAQIGLSRLASMFFMIIWSILLIVFVYAKKR